MSHNRDICSALSERVHVVVSYHSGMGKTLRIKRMAEVIDRVNHSEKPSYINVPIHGPEVSVYRILELITKYGQDPTDPHPQIIHFNVAEDVSY